MKAKEKKILSLIEEIKQTKSEIEVNRKNCKRLTRLASAKHKRWAKSMNKYAKLCASLSRLMNN